MRQKLRLAKNALKAAFTKKMLGPNAYALIVRSENGLFAVDLEDNGVGRKLQNSGRYGLDEIERMKPYIKPDSKILIVGAHIGTLAIPISKLYNRVTAIEANPSTYKLLTVNIALNAALNCQAVNIAASDKEEDIEFLLSRLNSGGGKRAPKIKDFKYYYDDPEAITIKAFSLDGYFSEEEFDIVFMDIEGSEYFALRRMQRILSKCKFFVVEFLPHHLKNVAGVTLRSFCPLLDRIFLQ
jgi:FkbM family methyltransferase